jgi:hypothetical protein
MPLAVRAAILGLALAICVAVAACGTTSTSTTSTLVPHAKAVPGGRSVAADGDPATVFSINGKSLTISSTDPIVLRFVRGNHVSALCFNRLGVPDEFSGALWGQGGTSVTLSTRSDLSKGTAICEAGRINASALLTNVTFSGEQRKGIGTRRPRVR